jgi:hypothetical protein
MTLREVMIVAQENEMVIRTYGSLQYQVNYREDDNIRVYEYVRMCDGLDEVAQLCVEMRTERSILKPLHAI